MALTPDRIQRQRFEYKYLISEHTALAVRDFVSSYLSLDSYGATQPNYVYPVHTLYLDSPDLILYRNTVNGDRNRFKLRVRFYENDEDRPVYLEIKRRANQIILKKRAAVLREGAADVVAGHLPDRSLCVDDSPAALDALHSFHALSTRISAVPQVHVSYLREAWMADGQTSLRVTLDRRVRTERRREFLLDPEMHRPTEIFAGQVVLELKFTDRYPRWFSDMVRQFGIRAGSAAKYVDGVYRLGDRGLISAFV